MWQWLTSWYAKYRVGSVRKNVEHRVRNSEGFVEIALCGGKVKLWSMNPNNPKAGKVIARPVRGGEPKVTEVTLNSSTWHGEAFFAFWGKPLNVELIAEGSRPSVTDERILQSLLDHPHCVKADVEEQVFDYYIAHVLPHDPTLESGEPLPQVHSPEEICRVVACPPSLTVDTSIEPSANRFTLHFQAKWCYHSIAVDVSAWKVVSVGLF